MKTLKTQYDSATSNTDASAYEREFHDLKSQLNMLTGEKFNGEALFSNTGKQMMTQLSAGVSLEYINLWWH